MTSYWYEHAVTGIRAEYTERFAKVFGDNLNKVDGPAPLEAHKEDTPRPSKRKSHTSSETSHVEVTDTTDSSKEGNE